MLIYIDHEFNKYTILVLELLVEKCTNTNLTIAY